MEPVTVLASIAGGAAVLAWRVRETQRPVTGGQAAGPSAGDEHRLSDVRWRPRPGSRRPGRSARSWPGRCCSRIPSSTRLRPRPPGGGHLAPAVAGVPLDPPRALRGALRPAELRGAVRLHPPDGGALLRPRLRHDRALARRPVRPLHAGSAPAPFAMGETPRPPPPASATRRLSGHDGHELEGAGAVHALVQRLLLGAGERRLHLLLVDLGGLQVDAGPLELAGDEAFRGGCGSGDPSS